MTKNVTFFCVALNLQSTKNFNIARENPYITAMSFLVQTDELIAPHVYSFISQRLIVLFKNLNFFSPVIFANAKSMHFKIKAT